LKTLFLQLFTYIQQIFGSKTAAEIELSRKIGYNFKNITLLRQALKHRSYLAESGEPRISSYERMELLGDAVLGMVITEYLYLRYPKKGEGDLTVVKSLVVSRKVLSDISLKLGIGGYILLSKSERKTGGENRPSILSDVLEGIIGAIYIDGGLNNARKFIHRIIIAELPSILRTEQNRNFKSLLLEYCQKEKIPIPRYLVKDEEGPDHDKLFTVQVYVGQDEYGLGRGRSKKRAEQKAARVALKKLDVI
jgi:ribonuclease-3